MSDLTRSLSQWIAKYSGSHLVVAYSGGRDSHVLLHALWQQRLSNPTLQLSAIHIHHGLQREAKNWVLHCQKVCQNYDIPLEIIHLQLEIPLGESLENIARQQRYAAFASKIQNHEILLTAHTVDDQAETFMLQLLRGSGPLGLAGIAPLKSLGKGRLARPLLEVSRQRIATYADQHQLSWIEDPTNADHRFRRNFLRHRIFPILHEVDPGFVASIARSSRHCAKGQQLLNEYLQADLETVLDGSNTLNISKLKRYSALKQAHLLRYWFTQLNVNLPSTVKLQAILAQMLCAKIDAQPCIAWGKWEIRRHQDKLYVLPKQKTQLETVTWDLTTHLSLGQSLWKASQVRGQGIAVSRISCPLTVQFREGGERCKQAGKTFTSSLKKILQTLKIPHWERPFLPLFYQGQNLVAVGDLFVCEGWQVQDPEELGWVIELNRA